MILFLLININRTAVYLAVRYGNDKSKTWRLINEISKRKQRTHCSIKALRNNIGEKLTDPMQVANYFNKSFRIRIPTNMKKADETDIKKVNFPLTSVYDYK